MADLEQIRLLTSAAGLERDRLVRQLAETGAQLTAERRRLAALQATGDPDETRAAADRIRGLVSRRRESVSAVAALQESHRSELEGLLGDDVELEGNVPLVLFPVRIEVRSDTDRSALRVRIFHDAVHAETLDEGLSDAERGAGIGYWNAVWQSGDPLEPWPVLVKATGTRRAPWVAEVLRPTNLDARPGHARTSRAPRLGAPASQWPARCRTGSSCGSSRTARPRKLFPAVRSRTSCRSG
jgi:hypothetical protein